jgi:hypothetical protein
MPHRPRKKDGAKKESAKQMEFWMSHDGCMLSKHKGGREHIRNDFLKKKNGGGDL